MLLSHTQVIQRIWGDAPVHVFRKGKKDPIDVTDAFKVNALLRYILDEMAYAKPDCHIRLFSCCRKHPVEYTPPTHEDLRAILPFIAISRDYKIDTRDVDYMEKYLTQGDGWVYLSKPVASLPKQEVPTTTIVRISYL